MTRIDDQNRCRRKSEVQLPFYQCQSSSIVLLSLSLLLQIAFLTRALAQLIRQEYASVDISTVHARLARCTIDHQVETPAVEAKAPVVIAVECPRSRNAAQDRTDSCSRSAYTDLSLVISLSVN